MRKGNKPSFTKRRITKYDAKQERWERALNECTVDVFIMHGLGTRTAMGCRQIGPIMHIE